MPPVFKLFPHQCCPVISLKNVWRKTAPTQRWSLFSCPQLHTSVIKLSCSPSEGADLILSTLLCVVLYCWLLNCKVWAVEGECCWSPLNSRSPVWLTPCGNPTEIPLHTSERSSSLSGAPQEYCCVPPWVRGPSSHTTALVLRLLQLLVFRVQ